MVRSRCRVRVRVLVLCCVARPTYGVLICRRLEPLGGTARSHSAASRPLSAALQSSRRGIAGAPEPRGGGGPHDVDEDAALGIIRDDDQDVFGSSKPVEVPAPTPASFPARMAGAMRVCSFVSRERPVVGAPPPQLGGGCRRPCLLLVCELLLDTTRIL